MHFYDLKYLIMVLISIDVVMVITCVLLMRKIRLMPKTEIFQRGVKIYESLLSDADKVVREFHKDVRVKQDLIRQLNTQLDKRIAGLNIIIQRADVLLGYEAASGTETGNRSGSALSRRKEIFDLTKKGCKAEEIANRLLIPKGEVKLLIDLNKKRKSA
ncbi:MAG: hypothetical protein QG578_1141 [Thermodesulfobacteriota bacterium]|nr:hypothetical protein [Thermodesulfobacteriota bacterium]